MSSFDDPAGSPVENGANGLGPITPRMVDLLRRTRPWVRLMSILGFVGSALMLLLALAMPFLAGISDEFGGVIGGVALGAMYLVFGCLYIFLSLYLFRYATAIKSLVETGRSASMELALSHQASFWRLVGIASLVMLCLYGILFLGLMVVGIGAALTDK